MNAVNQLRISLVIPAYNEESHLRQCLDAIAALRTKPFEVIVVDNNSTDATGEIARSYAFVKVVAAKRQGVVFARTAGFDAATGDIIGRIDVDTLLSPDWIATVQNIFADPDIAAVSGPVSYHDAPFRSLGARIDLGLRRYLANRLDREVYLYGANMAVRRSSWHMVRHDLCSVAGLHEDFDLAIHLQRFGERVIFDPRLQASVSGRRLDMAVRSFCQYVLRSPQTYAYHQMTSRRYMYPVVVAVIGFYFPFRMLYRAYDPVSRQLSLKRLFLAPVVNRVDPTIHHEAYLK